MQSRACWRLVGRPGALAPGATEGVWSALVHYRRLRRLMAVASGALIVAVTFALLERMIDRGLATRLPDLPPLPIADAFSDFTPVVVTITADWQKVNITVPVHALRSDVTLWRKMNFDDWDTVTQRLREDGLSAMRNRFGHLISNPQQWDRMDAHDWDLIPQPIRAMTYIQMIRYWSGYYQVGASFGLPRGTVTNTMSAIVMAESWFEHRARHVNADGHRDIGLGGFSEYCRRTLERLAGEGAVDFNMRGEDYFDPWHATRVVAVWFERMLQEANGDLDLAVRAYHRGRLLARRGEGTAYLANVKRLRQRFIRNEESTPAWDFLFVRAASKAGARAASGPSSDAEHRGGRQTVDVRKD